MLYISDLYLYLHFFLQAAVLPLSPYSHLCNSMRYRRRGIPSFLMVHLYNFFFLCVFEKTAYASSAAIWCNFGPINFNRITSKTYVFVFYCIFDAPFARTTGILHLQLLFYLGFYEDGEIRPQNAGRQGHFHLVKVRPLLYDPSHR